MSSLNDHKPGRTCPCYAWAFGRPMKLADADRSDLVLVAPVPGHLWLVFVFEDQNALMCARGEYHIPDDVLRVVSRESATLAQQDYEASMQIRRP